MSKLPDVELERALDERAGFLFVAVSSAPDEREWSARLHMGKLIVRAWSDTLERYDEIVLSRMGVVMIVETQATTTYKPPLDFLNPIVRMRRTLLERGVDLDTQPPMLVRSKDMGRIIDMQFGNGAGAELARCGKGIIFGVPVVWHEELDAYAGDST